MRGAWCSSFLGAAHIARMVCHWLCAFLASTENPDAGKAVCSAFRAAAEGASGE